MIPQYQPVHSDSLKRLKLKLVTFVCNMHQMTSEYTVVSPEMCRRSLRLRETVSCEDKYIKRNIKRDWGGRTVWQGLNRFLSFLMC